MRSERSTNLALGLLLAGLLTRILLLLAGLLPATLLLLSWLLARVRVLILLVHGNLPRWV